MPTLLHEGFRAAPWFHEMSRRGALGIASCDQCKQKHGTVARQHLACGYELPLDDKKRLTIWQPPSSKVGYTGQPLTVCAGYTVNLPEVVEAVMARAHCKLGSVGSLGTLSKDMLNALLIVEGQYSQLQTWLMTPAKDGGGGQ